MVRLTGLRITQEINTILIKHLWKQNQKKKTHFNANT